MKNLVTALSLFTAAALASSASGQVLVYANIFEEALGAEWSGVTTRAGVQNYAFAGNGANVFGGSMLYNDSTLIPGSALPQAQASVLSLTNLPAHSTVSLAFLLAVVDSWDGFNGSPAPDRFGIRIDGVQVFGPAFAIQSGASDYTPPPNGQIFNGAAGFSGFNDQGFDMGLEPSLQNIAHSASTMTIEFFAFGQGWQGGTDESWGIDNLFVTVNVIPAPSAMGLMGVGALVMGRRRR